MILYSRTTAPATLPVTLEEAKLHLKVDGTSENDYITSLIKVATGVCEAYAGLSFISQTRVIKLDSFRCRDLILPYGPVTAITSVAYVDDEDVSQTIASGDYTLDNSSGVNKIRITESWPYTNTVLNNVVITYVAGYANAAAVPEVVKQAIKMAITSLYEHRGDEDKGQVLNWAAMDLLDTVKVYWNAEY